MALTKEGLQLLVGLQKQDAAVDKLEVEMKKIPELIEAVKSDLEGEKTAMNDAKARVMNLEKKKKEKELELASKEEAAKKHGAELNQVKTNDAFKALQNQIEDAKKAAGDIETQILEIMVEIDSAKQEEKKLAGEFKKIEDDCKKDISVHESKLKELQAQFDALKAQRDAAAAPISPDAMKVYNHIRSRGKKDAVVAIDGDKCSACNMILPPSLIVEATKAKGLVCCESCQRILFRPEPAAAKA
jgi:uncharacterized protein